MQYLETDPGAKAKLKAANAIPVNGQISNGRLRDVRQAMFALNLPAARSRQYDQACKRRGTAVRPREKMVCMGNQCRFFSLCYEGRRRKPMADQSAANIAFERAWNVYLLINNDVDENDERRTTLERFIRKNCEAGENDPETLSDGGLTHLKRLD
jgi:hypothetical protein